MAVIAITAWYALGLQFYITVKDAATLVFYLTFFTILTNLLVAVGLTARLLMPPSKAGIFFSKQPVAAATALYIVVVGLVYNAILRWLWKPEGLQLIADTLLHVAVPVMFLLYWLLFVPKGNLKYGNVFTWLWYPLSYLVYVLIRGAIVNEYPYPFIDVTALGYPKMLLNSGAMLVVFLGLGLLFVFVGRQSKQRPQ